MFFIKNNPVYCITCSTFSSWNPLKSSDIRLLHFKVFSAIQVYATIFNFWHSGTLALSPERQSARMSEIKNVG